MMLDIKEEEPTDQTSHNGEKYLYCAVIVLALFALPETSVQTYIKMGVWTLILVGSTSPYIRSSIFDAVSRLTIAALCLVHCSIMLLSYSLIESNGYLAIGVAIIVEIILFSVPVGWLKVRRRRANDRN